MLDSSKCREAETLARPTEICNARSALEDITTADIGKVLAAQAAAVNKIGMDLIEEAEGMEGGRRSSRLRDAVKTLSASSRIFVEASKILERFEPPPAVLAEAREKLISRAIEEGYDIAFESDGKVLLERTGPSGGRFLIDEA